MRCMKDVTEKSSGVVSVVSDVRVRADVKWNRTLIEFFDRIRKF